MLAGGSGSSEFRSQMTSPLDASITTAARAVSRGIAPASRAGLSATTASANSAPIARGDRRVAIVSRVQRIRQLSTTARVRSSTVLTNALLMAFCTELFTPAG